MKTERQGLELLERLTGVLNRLAEKIPENVAEVTADQKAELAFVFGVLFGVGLMMDHEQQLRELVTHLNVAAALERLQGTL